MPPAARDIRPAFDYPRLMSLPTDPAENLAALIRCPSVTPAEGGALSVLEKMLKPLGFAVERPVFSEDGTPDVENLYARRSGNGPHLMFAGHTDVVPVGDEASWTHPPFSADVHKGEMYGRGAVDMKGGIACFVAAAARHVAAKGGFKGSVSLLITGDEEGPAINGTTKLLDWAAEKGESWDAALVGEPTNPDQLGDMIKIGRRGSISGAITVNGRQGHVAYPHLADNPVRGLMTLADALLAPVLDAGTKDFQPTNLEITSVDVGNPAVNVIPAKATARLQHPLQRHLDGRDAAGRDPQPSRPRQPPQEVSHRPRGADRLRSCLARPLRAMYSSPATRS